MWTRAFSRTAVRFWSILGTDKIRVGCFFFNIFLWHGDWHMGVGRIGSITTRTYSSRVFRLVFLF